MPCDVTQYRNEEAMTPGNELVTYTGNGACMTAARVSGLKESPRIGKTPPQKNRPRFYSFFQFIAVCGLLLLAHGCARVIPQPEAPKPPPGYPKPYKVLGKWYQPAPHAKGFVQKGIASWYGEQFHGRKTASGETYNMYAMTGAHKTLPLGTYVRVYNLNNDREVVVKINDRGPFVRNRIIDLSYTAAKHIEMIGPGTAPVKIVALGSSLLSGEKTPSRPTQDTTDYYTGNFTIQVGAFSDRKNAERLQAKLDQTYKNAHISDYNNGYETFYRVRVGRCSTLEQAEKFEELMIQKGFTGAFAIAE